MAINGIMEALGDFFEWTFKILPILGNIPNVLFIILGFVLLFFWLKMQSDFNKKAEREGTLK